MKRTTLILLAFGIVASGCTSFGSQDKTDAPSLSKTTGALTADQQAIYEACLNENMAVAVAWSMIEQQCLDRANGSSDPKPLVDSN